MGAGAKELPAKKDDSNVLIPDTGAAKYWYVDPRALQQFPQQQALNDQPFNPQGVSTSTVDPMVEAVNRMLRQPVSVQGSQQPYDPMAEVRLARQQDAERMSAEHQMGPQDVYKTVTMDLGNSKTGSQEMEVPAVFDNMTDEERNIIQYLPHTQWPDSIKMKIETNARDNLEQGNDAFGNPINYKF